MKNQEILKKGVKLGARKLNPKDKNIKLLIKQTRLEQEHILSLKKIDWENLEKQTITI